MTGSVLTSICCFVSVLSAYARLNDAHPVELHGALAPLGEKGYQNVARNNNDTEMGIFIRRIVDSLGMKVVDESGFEGLVPWFSGVTAVQTYTQLATEIRIAPWAAIADSSVTVMTTTLSPSKESTARTSAKKVVAKKKAAAHATSAKTAPAHKLHKAAAGNGSPKAAAVRQMSKHQEPKAAATSKMPKAAPSKVAPSKAASSKAAAAHSGKKAKASAAHSGEKAPALSKAAAAHSEEKAPASSKAAAAHSVKKAPAGRKMSKAAADQGGSRGPGGHKLHKKHAATPQTPSKSVASQALSDAVSALNSAKDNSKALRKGTSHKAVAAGGQFHPKTGAKLTAAKISANAKPSTSKWHPSESNSHIDERRVEINDGFVNVFRAHDDDDMAGAPGSTSGAPGSFSNDSNVSAPKMVKHSVDTAVGRINVYTPPAEGEEAPVATNASASVSVTSANTTAKKAHKAYKAHKAHRASKQLQQQQQQQKSSGSHQSQHHSEGQHHQKKSSA